MKVGFLVELFTPGVMTQYAEICGCTGYLGKSDAFDKAIAAFSIAYADQNERDHAVLKKAVRSGRVEVVMEP